MDKTKELISEKINTFFEDVRTKRWHKLPPPEVDKSILDDFNARFKALWQKADAKERKRMLAFSQGLPFALSWRSVLFGLDDISSAVKKQAITSLNKILDQITALDKYDRASSYAISKLSFFLYKHMKTSLDTEFIKFSIKYLLLLRSRGPVLVWCFFCQSFTHRDMILRAIEALPDNLKLHFLDQYTKDSFASRKDLYPLIKNLADSIEDIRSLKKFLADVFNQEIQLNGLIKETCIRIGLLEHVFRFDLSLFFNRQKKETRPVKSLTEIIQALKVVGLLGSHNHLKKFVPLLRRGIKNDIRYTVLNMFKRPDLKGDQAIISAVCSLLTGEDEYMVLYALRTLVCLSPGNLEEIILKILKGYPGIKKDVFHILPKLETVTAKNILTHLPSEEKAGARKIIADKITGRDIKLKTVLLNACAESSNSEIREMANSLLKEMNSGSGPEYSQAGSANEAFGFPANKQLRSGPGARIKNRFYVKRLLKGIPLKNVNVAGITLTGLNLSKSTLNNVDFSGAILKKIDFSNANISSACFKDAVLEDVIFDRSYIESSSFENARFKSVSFKGVIFSGPDFSNTSIFDTSFKEVEMRGANFEDSRLQTCNFTMSNMEESSFFGANIRDSRFILCNLYTSDISHAVIFSSSFSGSKMAMSYHLNTKYSKNGRTRSISLPLRFFEEIFFNEFEDAFNALLLSVQIKNQKGIFLKYNNRRLEIAMESFRPDQADLFDLIPFLIHVGENLLLYDSYTPETPRGIYGYMPSYSILKKVKRYFPSEEFDLNLEGKKDIESLFTIGSIGSIAQSEDSDIDYWVCTDYAEMGKEKIKQLNSKLKAISSWSSKIFRTKVHFFIMDKENVRNNDFGSSNKESSGSAQGKLLKEELYRTVVFVAGKLPLWWILPQNINDSKYSYFRKLASILNKNYIDLGNVDNIPLGEYFGASIWQVLKGLTSPYKSLLKIALLEKYATGAEGYPLLCNKLKANYNKHQEDPRKIDQYLLLLEEVLEFYRERNDQESLDKIQTAFYLKAGIGSLHNFKPMLTIDKKGLIAEYLNMWNWNEKKIQDLEHFKEWSFNRLAEHNKEVTRYMIQTYKRISNCLGKIKDTVISPSDLTFFGRIIASRLIQKRAKVDRLVVHPPSNHNFKWLYIKFKEKASGVEWKLIQSPTGPRAERKQEILKISDRIEFLGAWIINNGLFSRDIYLNLSPNPFPILIQDIQELLNMLMRFFPDRLIEDLLFEDMLRDPYIKRLLLVINFTRSRKEDKIFEYTAIYDNSWGERFCRTFYNNKGLSNKEEILRELTHVLGIPFKPGVVDFYAPRRARRALSSDLFS